MPQGRETVKLPVFPIHGVLFPAMRLNIRVAHSHYQASLEDLVRTDATLSVSLLRHPRDGAEVSSDPHLIGTTARILDVTRINNDSDEVVLIGISRIHLLSYRHNGRHLVGQARYLPDLNESVPSLLLEEARALGSELWSTMPTASRPPGMAQPVPKEAEALSYWVAQNLPIGCDDRQELLELRTTSTRLSKEVGHMRVILDALRSEPSPQRFQGS
jgi:Lon protease-like protein